MAPQSFTDVAALSAALMSLRPRAKAAPMERQAAPVAGLGLLTWMCAAPSAGTRGEWIGIDLAEAQEPGQQFNRQAFVDLLPEEMVPTKVSEKGQRIAFAFQVTPGHFRCRDCRWGDATDARGTHPGVCTACSAAKTEGVRKAHLREGWDGAPAPPCTARPAVIGSAVRGGHPSRAATAGGSAASTCTLHPRCPGRSHETAPDPDRRLFRRGHAARPA